MSDFRIRGNKFLGEPGLISAKPRCFVRVIGISIYTTNVESLSWWTMKCRAILAGLRRYFA